MTNSTDLLLIGATLKRETDKAVLLNVEIDSAVGCFDREIWFPKSQIRNENGRWIAKAWLVKAKEREMPRRPGDFRAIVADHISA